MLSKSISNMKKRSLGLSEEVRKDLYKLAPISSVLIESKHSFQCISPIRKQKIKLLTEYYYQIFAYHVW